MAQPPALGAEAVMNAYVLPSEGRRTLQHDDVATFLFAASGLDETAGTSDDYTVDIVYQGRTRTGCDVVIEDLPLDGTPGVAARCQVAGILIGGSVQHFRIAGESQIQVLRGDQEDWYYGAEVFIDDFESGDTSSWTEATP